MFKFKASTLGGETFKYSMKLQPIANSVKPRVHSMSNEPRGFSHTGKSVFESQK